MRSKLMKKTSSTDYNRLVEKISIGIKKIKGVQAVVLFGSYARGEQKPISDIDICVLADRKISSKTKAEIASFSSRKIDISIFWDLPASVRFQVMKEGKILFSKSEEEFHIARVQTVSEYLDFKHILDRNVSRVFGNE